MSIVVEEYNPEWKSRFESLKSILQPCVESFCISIEHVGSTSIPGLCAKPIIDVDIVIHGPEALKLAIPALQSIGYLYKGNMGIPGREVFALIDKTQIPFKHNLYVCFEDSISLRNHLLFRDTLATSPDLLRQYSQLKRELALECSDLTAYCEGKTSFITAVLATAGLSEDELTAIRSVN